MLFDMSYPLGNSHCRTAAITALFYCRSPGVETSRQPVKIMDRRLRTVTYHGIISKDDILLIFLVFLISLSDWLVVSNS